MQNATLTKTAYNSLSDVEKDIFMCDILKGTLMTLIESKLSNISQDQIMELILSIQKYGFMFQGLDGNCCKTIMRPK